MSEATALPTEQQPLAHTCLHKSWPTSKMLTTMRRILMTDFPH